MCCGRRRSASWPGCWRRPGRPGSRIRWCISTATVPGWTRRLRPRRGRRAGFSREVFSLVSPPRPGSHGFLVFEDPGLRGGSSWWTARRWARLLADAGVPVLVLNACRSAHADLATEPETVTGEGDAHRRVRAYGSLAQEVMDAGVAGVVAMRYNVYVVTAARFIGDVYAGLLAGRPLGRRGDRGAAAAGRRPAAAGRRAAGAVAGLDGAGGLRGRPAGPAAPQAGEQGPVDQPGPGRGRAGAGGPGAGAAGRAGCGVLRPR